MSLGDELARCFDALNVGDPQPFLELYDPAIELFVPAWASPEGGHLIGAEAVNRWYANNFAQWADQHWDLVEILEHGPTVAYVVHWAARGKRSGIGLEGDFMGVMSFLDGKIVTIAHFGGAGTSPTQ